MLSFIYRMMRDFELEHGMKPNVLHLNNEHFDKLREDFLDPDNIEAIIGRLEMEIVIEKNTLHPHLSWIESSYRKVASF